MATVKSSKDIAAKWARVTQGRTADYTAGVKAPRKSWATQAKGAEDNYKAGVAAAAQEGRFGKGIDKAGDKTWQDRAVSVGVARWGSGVAVAQNSFEQGFAPFADVISRTELSPRYPKGDPRNIERVRQIGEALNKKRLEM